MTYCKPNTKYIFVLMLFMAMVLTSMAQVGKYPIQNFTPSDYKAGIQNIDFAQNRDLTIYVANNLGVLAYDGNDWEVHAFQSGKKQRSLAFDDQSDRLYVGSQGDFGFFSEEWRYESLIDLVPAAFNDFDEVWDVFIVESNVYFCTFKNIYVYDGTTISAISHPAGFDRCIRVNGHLFAQSREGELYEIKGEDLSLSNKQRQSNDIIAGIIPQGRGYLFFFNSGRIELSSTFPTSGGHEKLIESLKGKFVNHVLQLSDTRLAISTQTAGIYLYNLNDQRIERITKKSGLQSNACLRTFEDFAGNLWVGMQSGMALIDIKSPLRLLNDDINLQGSGYEAFQTNDGTYFSTSNGIYFLAEGKTQCVFLKGTEGPAYGFERIGDQLYVGHHSGLFRLTAMAAEKIIDADGVWHVKPLVSKPQYAIAGTYSGLILFQINESMELEIIGKIDGFHESSRFFEEDNEGRIIVGQYYKGLYELTFQDDLTKVEVRSLSEGKEAPIQDQIILSKMDNELFIATNQGLYKFDQASRNMIKAGSLYEQIGPQPIYLFRQDPIKNIHLVSENKVGYFKQISANNYVFVPSSLNKLRYFLNNDLLQVSVNIDKGVMFSANEGFLYYNSMMENRISVKKTILLKKVYDVSQGKILFARKPFADKPKTSSQITINQQTKVIQFEVTSYQFQGVSNKQFRYQLKGFENEYGTWTNATTKEYSNLREGDYEFHVQSKNFAGEITTSIPLHIEVKPPFFRSGFAKLIYVLFGLTALFMVSKFQKRRYQQKTLKIEELKRNELELEQQKLQRVERQTKQELQQLEEAKIESELRHLNNLLAASTMNLVVKNEFIENIKQELKEVRRKGKHPETKQALEKIEKEIDTTLRLQEDWKQFEYHFDQVHGDFLTRLREEFYDLSPNDHKLCAFLRLNLNTKEISNLMGISLRGVEVARYRLRKKLGLKKGENLSKYILEF